MNVDLLKKSVRLSGLSLALVLACSCSAKDNTQSDDQKPEKPVVAQEKSPFGLYQVLVDDFYAMTREQGQMWQSAVDLLDYEKVLVLSELNKEEDYVRHGEYLDKYISASEKYLDFLKNLESKATEKFTAYDLSEKQVSPVVDKLLSTYQKQKDSLISLLDAHIGYGNKMKTLLQFLQTNQQDWKLVNNQIDMEDKELARQYNAIIDEIVLFEDQIELHSKELDFHLKE